MISADERWVFRVGPWRRFVLWYTVGPIVAFLLVLAAREDENTAGALWITAGIFTAIMLPVHWLIRRTRLELDRDGIRLVQTGWSLATSWSEVSGVRLERGREGLITRSPMAGPGPETLAGARGVALGGDPMFDATERALLAERRYIPLAPFAWHLRSGNLRDALCHFAPQLTEVFAAPLPPDTARPGQRARLGWLLAFCGVLAMLGLALGFADEDVQERVLGVAWAVLAPLLAFRAGLSARNALAAGSRLMCAMFAVLAVLMLGWTLFSWSAAWELLRR
jgi:hypothetical protein